MASEPRFQSWTSRLYIVSAFYAVVIASLPFWYRTTTIVRLPLPTEKIELAESRLPCPVRIPFQLNLELPSDLSPPAFPFFRAGNEGESYQTREDWEQALVHDMERRLERAGDGIVTSRGGSDFATAVQPSEHAACVDWELMIGKQEIQAAQNGGCSRLLKKVCFCACTQVALKQASAYFTSTTIQRRIQRAISASHYHWNLRALPGQCQSTSCRPLFLRSSRSCFNCRTGVRRIRPWKRTRDLFHTLAMSDWSSH